MEEIQKGEIHINPFVIGDIVPLVDEDAWLTLDDSDHRCMAQHHSSSRFVCCCLRERFSGSQDVNQIGCLHIFCLWCVVLGVRV